MYSKSVSQFAVVIFPHTQYCPSTSLLLDATRLRHADIDDGTYAAHTISRINTFMKVIEDEVSSQIRSWSL